MRQAVRLDQTPPNHADDPVDAAQGQAGATDEAQDRVDRVAYLTERVDRLEASIARAVALLVEVRVIDPMPMFLAITILKCAAADEPPTVAFTGRPYQPS